MSIVEFSTYFGEWPYIFIISIAVYLSFEYWRFPDLTIESSFTAGTVAAYIAFTNGHRPLVWLTLLLVLPILYAGGTWVLARLHLPPLFAGLLVVLMAYSFNFWLNDKQVNQGGFLRDYGARLPRLFQSGSINIVEKFFVFYFVLAMLIILLLVALSKSKLGMRIYLSRRTKDPAVPDAIGINHYLYLFLCMCTYNVVAYVGGVGFALSNDTSAVSLLGAITPGLACMFIVKAAKDYVSAPSKVNAPAARAGRVSGLFLQKSDSLWFILLVLFLLSGLVAWARFQSRNMFKAEVGLLNALTAVATFAVWAAIAGFAYLLGKKVQHGGVNNY